MSLAELDLVFIAVAVTVAAWAGFMVGSLMAMVYK